MVNNSTNIRKTSDYFLPQAIENKTYHTTYFHGNSGYI